MVLASLPDTMSGNLTASSDRSHEGGSPKTGRSRAKSEEVKSPMKRLRKYATAGKTALSTGTKTASGMLIKVPQSMKELVMYDYCLRHGYILTPCGRLSIACTIIPKEHRILHRGHMRPQTETEFVDFVNQYMKARLWNQRPSQPQERGKHVNVEELAEHVIRPVVDENGDMDDDTAPIRTRLERMSSLSQNRVSWTPVHQLAGKRGTNKRAEAVHTPSGWAEISTKSWLNTRKRRAHIRIDGTGNLIIDGKGDEARTILLAGCTVRILKTEPFNCVFKVRSPYAHSITVGLDTEADLNGWVAAVEYWAVSGMEDYDDNGLVWTPLLSLFESYTAAVTMPHVDLQTDMLRVRLETYVSWALDLLDRTLTEENKAAISAMMNEYKRAYRIKWSFDKNLDIILRPMVLNLIDVVVGRDGLEELMEEYSQWRPDDPKVPALNICILTVGSRGDVQPFIALAQTLQGAGHNVRIGTHEVFRKFVTSNGVEFFRIAGDPKELMAAMVDHDMFSVEFIKQNVLDKRAWFKDLLRTCYDACTLAWDGVGEKPRVLPNGAPGWDDVYSCDVLIANPPSFAGPHIAEALGIPLYLAGRVPFPLQFTMPMTPTREVPSPFFADANSEMPGYINWYTFEAYDKMLFLWSQGMINTFRERLGLTPLVSGSDLVHARAIPFLYCFSEKLLPRPSDWLSHINITGFWLLNESSSGYTPDPALQAFLDAGEAPIYVGFGSIVVKDPLGLSKTVVAALKRIGKRAIIQAGWAGLDADALDIPDHIKVIGAVPHDWLFPRMRLVVHHGGAGTMSTGLLFGKPTVIIPFFGDQFFWGRTVSKAGAGPAPVPYEQLNVDNLAAAIQHAMQPEVEARAKELAAAMGAEHGTEVGSKAIHLRLPTNAIKDDLVPSLKGEVSCSDCNLIMSVYTDCVLHCSSDRPDMKGHSRFLHVKMDWSRGYSAPLMYRSRGYHGDPLNEDDIRYIEGLTVEKALKEMVLQSFAQWKPDSKPTIPMYALKTRMMDKMYSAVKHGLGLRVPSSAASLAAGPVGEGSKSPVMWPSPRGRRISHSMPLRPISPLGQPPQQTE